VCVPICLTLCYAGRVWAQSVTDEYRQKAIYLRKIPNFVEWPAERGDRSGSKAEPIHICVAGNYSFGVLLVQEAERASESGQKMGVRLIRNKGEWKGCEVAFVSRSEARRYGQILEELKGSNVLTVGETDGFLEAGGIVELDFRQGQLRFEVNLSAAQVAQLKIDARLLAMAKRVIRDKERALN
jgi:hypothetical protein